MTGGSPGNISNTNGLLNESAAFGAGLCQRQASHRQDDVRYSSQERSVLRPCNPGEARILRQALNR